MICNSNSPQISIENITHLQISLELQTGGRNNEISNEIMEIVKDLTVSAFRGSQVNLNMEDFDGSSANATPFPVFLRKSQMVTLKLHIAYSNVL